MIRIKKHQPPRVLVAELSGELTRHDFDEVLGPEVDRCKEELRKEPLSLVMIADGSLTGMTAETALGDVQFAFRHRKDFARVALVTDNPWLQVATHLMAPLIDAEVKVFHSSEGAAAADWAGSMQAPSIHRMNRKQGIVTIEPKGEIESHQLEDLAKDVDDYLKTHHALRGVLIEVGQFPGWQNLGALVQHLRFIKDHHQRVAKVAIISDALANSPLPLAADLVLATEVRAFRSWERRLAREWLSNPF